MARKILRVNPVWDPGAGQFAGGVAYTLEPDTELDALSDQLEAACRDRTTLALDAWFNEQPVRLVVNGARIETAFVAEVDD
jgi:hypothetical protein